MRRINGTEVSAFAAAVVIVFASFSARGNEVDGEEFDLVQHFAHPHEETHLNQ